MRAKFIGGAAIFALIASSLLIPASAQAAATKAEGANYPNGKAHGWNNGQPIPVEFNARPSTAASVGGPSGTAPITYHGGLAPKGGGTNVGVSAGTPKVFLVFWGSQWGTQGSTTVNGFPRDTFTGDPSGMAPYLESLMAGLGTSGDNWSGVVTQYCNAVATGSTGCALNATSTTRAGFPAGGALAGIWYDNSVALSTSTTNGSYPSQAQLAAEAISAANHFGMTSQTANLAAQYVIVSPTGVHPDGFNAGANFCAWHSYTSSTATGNIAYTNLPYIPDMGGSCGANFVNAGTAGALDGVSIVEGHEYAETQTDQWPGSTGGYWDASGYENGDKCSWTSTSDPRNGGNLVLNTGTFAMQGTWSNLNAWCSMGSPLAGATTYSGQASATPSGQLVTGGIFPYTITNASLPGTLAIGTDGRLSGLAPATAATYPYSFTVTDAAGTVSNVTGTFTATPPPPKTNTSLVISASAISVTSTTSVTLKATISPVVSAATVSFYDGSTLLGTATTNTSGVASLAKTFAAGAHVISASYAGNTTYNGSTSGTVTVNSIQATTVTITTSTTGTTVNTQVTFTATLSAKVAGLTIAFQNAANSTQLGTGVTNANGVATLVYAFPTAATYSVRAVFGGNSTLASSSSGTVSVRVR